MNPRTDDILSEVAFSEGVGMRELSTELSAAIKQRCASNARVLGLQTPPRTPDAGGLSSTPRPCTEDTLKINHANRGRVASEISRINNVEESSPMRRLVYGGPVTPDFSPGAKKKLRHSTGSLHRFEVLQEEKEVLPREAVLQAWKERRRLEEIGLVPERHRSVDVFLEDNQGSFEWQELLPCCCGRGYTTCRSPLRTEGDSFGGLQSLLSWVRRTTTS